MQPVMPRILRSLAVMGLALAPVAALAADPPTAPGGQITPTGVSGSYGCSAGPAGKIDFRFVDFADGLHHVEERGDGGPAVGVYRYSWQLATATLYRERVSAAGATKFRRVTGSLRTLHELAPGTEIIADYLEASLDASAEPIEWRYRIKIGRRAASFAPAGLGEVAIVQIEESRTRYVDGQGRPLKLNEAANGFDRQETARIAYAPALGLPLRIERMSGGRTVEACSLSSYRKG